MVAAICLAGAVALALRLRTDFRDREEHRPLTPSEDTTMGVVLALCHIVLLALILQARVSVFPDDLPDASATDASGYVEGSRALFGVQVLLRKSLSQPSSSCLWFVVDLL